jgi:serine/threonine protein kinase
MVEGEQLTPNLLLVRPLGRANTSQVWLAHHSKLGIQVAVKVLDRPLARLSPQLHRFQREAEMAGHIKSSHVARVLEHGVSAAGLPYLVMELLEGEDMASRLTRDGPMSLAEVGRLVTQIARGLGKAHPLGLVHRNLTPANVFLANAADRSFDVKVLDVGLSSRSDFSGGRVFADMAAPEFASPEQIFGVKDVDFRADLWAIAIVGYYALTGRTPFRANTLDALTKAIEKGVFDPPSTIVSSVPSAVDAWFVKALQRDPAARFGGAKEMADEFARAAGIDNYERLALPSYIDLVPNERVRVIGAKSKKRTGSALVIAIIALVGLGTVLAGLSLLQQP